MLGLQPLHVLIIIIVAVIVFGPSRLPGAGRALVKTWREFQAGLTGEPAEPVPAVIPAKPPWVIFLSSVMRDMAEERATVERAIGALPPLARAWTFEKDSYAADKPVEEEYLPKVAGCDVFLLVLRVDITQPVRKEWDTAHRAGKPRLVFLKRCERSPEAQAFAAEIGEELTYREYETLEQLDVQVRIALGKLVLESQQFREELKEAQLAAVLAMVASLEAVQIARAGVEGLVSPVEAPMPGNEFKPAPVDQPQPTRPNISVTAPEPQHIEAPQPLFRPTYKYGRDGKRMVLIPAGWFPMGSGEYEFEKPIHRVDLDAFYIAETPVTNAEYKKFVDATGHAVPFYDSDWAKPYNWDKMWRTFPSGKDKHPVVLVSWDDANAYALWAGGRLPTEAEWEKAARGKDGRRYPWSDNFDAQRCNTFESDIHGTTPVDQYPGGASPYVVLDMAGNVWEWCADWYDPGYYKHSPPHNPTGPASGAYRVLRGGSWLSNQVNARCACRDWNYPVIRDFNIGFRIAESVTP